MKKITLAWINQVFWPYHARLNSVDKHCVLILDNFSGQKGFTEEESSSLPVHLHLLYLPPDMTSHHQPCDMGIIASMKLGYKAALLGRYLWLFDIDGGYLWASELRAWHPPGCKGLDYGGKATVLDCMNLLLPIWDNENKYVT